MKEDIQSAVGRELKVVEFDTVQDEAQGLLDGKSKLLFIMRPLRELLKKP